MKTELRRRAGGLSPPRPTKTSLAKTIRTGRGVVGGLTPLTRRAAVLLFVLVALLALPIFAHGCHGDDVDHEPLFIPFRLNADDR